MRKQEDFSVYSWHTTHFFSKIERRNNYFSWYFPKFCFCHFFCFRQLQHICDWRSLCIPGNTCVYLQSDPKSLWTPATTKAPHRQVEDCQAMVALLRSCLSLQDHNDEILRTGGQSSREWFILQGLRYAEEEFQMNIYSFLTLLHSSPEILKIVIVLQSFCQLIITTSLALNVTPSSTAVNNLSLVD